MKNFGHGTPVGEGHSRVNTSALAGRMRSRPRSSSQGRLPSPEAAINLRMATMEVEQIGNSTYNLFMVADIIPRRIQPTVVELAQSFPVVTVTGPRQSGKTTLCKSIAQNHLLAQAGGYVLAEKATLNIAEMIRYQAPKFDGLQDDEGRFGTELARTRDIFFSTSPQSLVPGPSSSQASFSNLPDSRSRKMDSYLVRHYQATGAAGGKGFVTFVPIIITGSKAPNKVDGQDDATDTGIEKDEESGLR